MEHYLALAEIQRALTPEYKERFDDILLGIIACNIRLEDWEDALEKAAIAFEEYHGFPVKIPVAEVQ